MKHFPTRFFVPLLTALLTVLLGNVTAISTPVGAATASCAWHTAPSPSFGGVLWGVAASSQTDAWAVGSYSQSAITEHWSGRSWSWIPSPQPDNYANNLAGVAALSSSDAWAVGSQQNLQGVIKTLIEHWNGSHWNVVKSPSPGSPDGLGGVTALAPDNVWAFGEQGGLHNPNTKTLIEHWNGTQWSIVKSSNIGTVSNGLGAATALSPNNIWAVGSDANGNGGARTLVEHWNGTQWTVVPSPNIGLFDNGLASVAGTAPNDIWAAGWYDIVTRFGTVSLTLTEHWNGTQWSVVKSPNPGGGNSFLYGVTALASNNVWAVGASAYYPLIIHWDGHQWHAVHNSGQHYWFLTRIAAANSHDLWTVGSTTTLTLIMHYC